MKIWGKLWKDNHLLADTVVTEESEDTRTHKIFRLLDEICVHFDLGRPIWLDKNIREFKAHSRTRFYQDSFVEEISFDSLEIQVLEE